MSVSPSNRRADVGSPAKFTCLVSGFPVRGVTWLRNGRQISPGNGGDEKVAFSRDKTVNVALFLLSPIDSRDRLREAVPGMFPRKWDLPVARRKHVPPSSYPSGGRHF